MAEEDTTVFQRIISGELPSEKVFESETLIAIKDIAPVAPVHLLIIPKECYASLQSVPSQAASVMAEVVEVAQKLAKEEGVENNYRLVTNVGPDSGQTVFHLHFHLIGGRLLGPMG